MKKFIINTLFGLCAVLMACGTASAQAFYENLSQTTGIPCGDTYVLENGLLLGGPTNCFQPAAARGIGWPFVAQNSGRVAQVNFLFTPFCDPPGSVSVGIYTNQCGGLGAPDTLVARREFGLTAATTTQHCPFTNQNANLTAGVRYWLVIEARGDKPKQTGTMGVWWAPNLGNFASGAVSLGDSETASIEGPGGFAVTP